MTRQWRPLPDSLSPQAVYLVRLLRELKDRSGLSLMKLERRTNYSKSSWERYLNGKALPPRHAVHTLAGLVHEPLERPMALWEQAQETWSGRAVLTETEPVPVPVRRSRWAEVIATAMVMLCQFTGPMVAAVPLTGVSPPAACQAAAQR
ncbi:XRE family transcriptional regulator [Pseudonocardiaceae bacterium YIM PH 21723]|nr:XRE family transcriptional regulator [Pseudonocardiaceae bacterium YIM PH 21723]